jgi:hypothetical protein
MTTGIAPARSRTTSTVLLAVAGLSLVFPLYAFVRWLIIAGGTTGQAEAAARFYGGFPQGMQARGVVEWLSAGLCLVTVVAAGVARGRLTGPARTGLTALLTFAALLGIWNVFTLM